MRHMRPSRPAPTRLAAACLLAVTLAAPAAAQDGQEEVSIVAFGDSLMAGYELPGPAAFPMVLDRALDEAGFANVTIVNAGVSGDTASGGLARLDWSVPDGTDGVILELGANDMLRGVDPQVTYEALDAMIERLDERGIPVLLAGMYAARNMGPDYVEAFDAIYPRLAEEHDLVLYPFFLEGALGNPEMMLSDGIHPNVEGVETMVENMLPTVIRFLEERVLVEG
ncbi:arylesterase [Salinarimonas ramus]|uniref:Arylesterase n=1 Tax=Salinarimonas ramus TaxID=690164 RepID=A0A917Q9P2_9HYPH|nr:arylesterase [Salinarimonas ramus]GGK37471.1 arylesterase [Salinarimonas ramus]